MTMVLPVLRGRGGKQHHSSMLQRITETGQHLSLWATAIARHGMPQKILYFYGGLGDALLCTIVARELRQRGCTGIWLVNDHPDVLRLNTDVVAVVPVLSRMIDALSRAGVPITPLHYATHVPGERRDILPKDHIVQVMCRRAGIRGTIEAVPHFEIPHDIANFGMYSRRQVAIQSSGLAARFSMRTKEWSSTRYQRVVQELARDYTFVQIGSATDPPLNGAIDMRGQCSVQQTAAILRNSAAFVGGVGFLMHLARAVNCRSVIIYGGRESPFQSGYGCNVNLASPIACSPCGLIDGCPYDIRCMQMIESDHAIEGVRTQMAKFGTPVEVDRMTIDS